MEIGFGFQTNHGLFIFSVISAYRLNCYPFVYLALLIQYHMQLEIKTNLVYKHIHVESRKKV